MSGRAGGPPRAGGGGRALPRAWKALPHRTERAGEFLESIATANHGKRVPGKHCLLAGFSGLAQGGFELLGELVEGHMKGREEFVDGVETRDMKAALELAHVRAIDPGLVGQALLGKAGLMAQPAQAQREGASQLSPCWGRFC